MTQEEVFIKYHDKIEKYIWSKVSDEYLAQDLTSVVFLKIYQKMENYDESKASISTWIYTIANNTVIDYYRTRKVSEEVPEDIAAMEEIDEDILREESLAELASALKQLSERDRDIIVLHYCSNISLKDIAIKMRMSYANIKKVHAKALMRLKELIKIDDYPF